MSHARKLEIGERITAKRKLAKFPCSGIQFPACHERRLEVDESEKQQQNDPEDDTRPPDGI